MDPPADSANGCALLFQSFVIPSAARRRVQVFCASAPIQKEGGFRGEHGSRPEIAPPKAVFRLPQKSARFNFSPVCAPVRNDSGGGTAFFFLDDRKMLLGMTDEKKRDRVGLSFYISIIPPALPPGGCAARPAAFAPPWRGRPSSRPGRSCSWGRG